MKKLSLFVSIVFSALVLFTWGTVSRAATVPTARASDIGEPATYVPPTYTFIAPTIGPGVIATDTPTPEPLDEFFFMPVVFK